MGHKDQRGMTIVEVLISFAILLLAASAFAACLAASNNLMDKAQSIRQSAYDVAEANAGAAEAEAGGVTASYHFTYGSLAIDVPVRGSQAGGVPVFAPAQ